MKTASLFLFWVIKANKIKQKLVTHVSFVQSIKELLQRDPSHMLTQSYADPCPTHIRCGMEMQIRQQNDIIASLFTETKVWIQPPVPFFYKSNIPPGWTANLILFELIVINLSWISHSFFLYWLSALIIKWTLCHIWHLL